MFVTVFWKGFGRFACYGPAGMRLRAIANRVLGPWPAIKWLLSAQHTVREREIYARNPIKNSKRHIPEQVSRLRLC